MSEKNHKIDTQTHHIEDQNITPTKSRQSSFRKLLVTLFILGSVAAFAYNSDQVIEYLGLSSFINSYKDQLATKLSSEEKFLATSAKNHTILQPLVQQEGQRAWAEESQGVDRESSFSSNNDDKVNHLGDQQSPMNQSLENINLSEIGSSSKSTPGEDKTSSKSQLGSGQGNMSYINTDLNNRQDGVEDARGNNNAELDRYNHVNDSNTNVVTVPNITLGAFSIESIDEDTQKDVFKSTSEKTFPGKLVHDEQFKKADDRSVRDLGTQPTKQSPQGEGVAIKYDNFSSDIYGQVGLNYGETSGSDEDSGYGDILSNQAGKGDLKSEGKNDKTIDDVTTFDDVLTEDLLGAIDSYCGSFIEGNDIELSESFYTKIVENAEKYRVYLKNASILIDKFRKGEVYTQELNILKTYLKLKDTLKNIFGYKYDEIEDFIAKLENYNKLLLESHGVAYQEVNLGLELLSKFIKIRKANIDYKVFLDYKAQIEQGIQFFNEFLYSKELQDLFLRQFWDLSVMSSQ